MNQIMLDKVSGTENKEAAGGKKTKAAIWSEVITAMVDPTSGMEESERQGYEQKIMQKLRSGKRLTSEEMEYLRIHNPELYRTAVRVENARKALRQRLKSCKSKEEAQQVITGQMEVLKAMKNDPDREYMAAMVKEEISNFKKSREYARLPVKREDGKKKMKKSNHFSGVESWEKEKEQAFYGKIVVYSRMQLQCSMITRMTRAFL